MRYKNWKFYYTMVPTGNPADGLIGATTYHWSLVDNIKRDPFEMATGETQGTLFGMGGALAGPAPLMCTTGTCSRSANSYG